MNLLNNISIIEQFIDRFIQDRVIDLGVPVPSNGGELDHFWQDVAVLDASYTAPWTTVRLLRKLNTADSEDIPIVVSIFCRLYLEIKNKNPFVCWWNY